MAKEHLIDLDTQICDITDMIYDGSGMECEICKDYDEREYITSLHRDYWDDINYMYYITLMESCQNGVDLWIGKYQKSLLERVLTPLKLSCLMAFIIWSIMIL